MSAKHFDIARDTLSSVSVYEKTVSSTDLTWQSELLKSLMLFWDLVEELLFGKQLMPTIMHGLKHHRSAAEILGADDFKGKMQAIKHALDAEKSASQQHSSGATVTQAHGDGQGQDKDGDNMSVVVEVDLHTKMGMDVAIAMFPNTLPESRRSLLQKQ